LSSVLGHYILVNHLIIDKHSLYEVKGSEKIELFIASPQGYYYPVFPPLIPKNSGLLNKIKSVISCQKCTSKHLDLNCIYAINAKMSD